jgi:uncharacterized protein YajQ (UPF0234 family)
MAAIAQKKLKTKYDIKELVKARREHTATPKVKILTDDFAPVEMLKTIKHHNEKRE